MIIVGASCVLAGPATVALSATSTRVHGLAAVVGVVLAAFGLYWGSTHGDEPEIFSPVLVGYLGAPLAIDGTAGVLVSRRTRER